MRDFLSKFRWPLLFIVLGIGLAIISTCLRPPFAPVLAQVFLVSAWVLTIIALFGFASQSCKTSGGSQLCFLLNDEKRLSLSRVQAFSWFVVIASALLVAVVANLTIEAYRGKALMITLPKEIWIAMGISFTTVPVSNLILNDRKDRAARRSAQVADSPGVPVVRELQKNDQPNSARAKDLVTYEEQGLENSVDLTRFQNLFLTAILLGTYAVAVGQLFWTAAAAFTGCPEGLSCAIMKFPEMDESFIALLAVSTAGYLGGKAVDKQVT